MNPKQESCNNGTISPDEVQRMLETQSRELIIQQKQLIAVTDQLEMLNERLKLADQRKDEFVSMVVHELRNPLASISQGIDCARGFGGEALPHKTLEHLDLVKRNVRRLNRILSDLLDFAKLESDKLKVDLDIVDPANALSETRLTYISEAERAKVAIEMQTEGPLPPVLADPIRIEQVLGNLISNALKFTPAEGTVTLSAAHGGTNVLFSVADTGSGIPRRYHEIIFEKYRQLTAQEGGGKKGTGLGLPICRHLVKLHGGSIGVESEHGSGSRFYFTIPLYTLAGRINRLAETFSDALPSTAWRIDLAGGAGSWVKAHLAVRTRIGEREWTLVDPKRERLWILTLKPETTKGRIERMIADGLFLGTLLLVDLPDVTDVPAFTAFVDRE